MVTRVVTSCVLCEEELRATPSLAHITSSPPIRTRAYLRRIRMKNAFLFTVCVLIVGAVGYMRGDCRPMRHMTAITFRRGEYTIQARSPPMPTMECVDCAHQVADSAHQPDIMQCTSVGLDGEAPQWKCEGYESSDARITFSDVVCEGCNYAGDTDIRVGTCILEYGLKWTPPPPVVVQSPAPVYVLNPSAVHAPSPVPVTVPAYTPHPAPVFSFGDKLRIVLIVILFSGLTVLALRWLVSADDAPTPPPKYVKERPTTPPVKPRKSRSRSRSRSSKRRTPPEVSDDYNGKTTSVPVHTNVRARSRSSTRRVRVAPPVPPTQPIVVVAPPAPTPQPVVVVTQRAPPTQPIVVVTQRAPPTQPVYMSPAPSAPPADVSQPAPTKQKSTGFGTTRSR